MNTQTVVNIVTSDPAKTLGMEFAKATATVAGVVVGFKLGNSAVSVVSTARRVRTARTTSNES